MDSLRRPDSKSSVHWGSNDTLYSASARAAREGGSKVLWGGWWNGALGASESSSSTCFLAFDVVVVFWFSKALSASPLTVRWFHLFYQHQVRLSLLPANTKQETQAFLTASHKNRIGLFEKAHTRTKQLQKHHNAEKKQKTPKNQLHGKGFEFSRDNRNFRSFQKRAKLTWCLFFIGQWEKLIWNVKLLHTSGKEIGQNNFLSLTKRSTWGLMRWPRSQRRRTQRQQHRWWSPSFPRTPQNLKKRKIKDFCFVCDLEVSYQKTCIVVKQKDSMKKQLTTYHSHW